MPESRLSEVDWLQGGVYGAVAFIAGIVLTMTWLYFDHMGTIMQVEMAIPGDLIALSIALFYEAQFVIPTGILTDFELTRGYIWDFGTQRGYLSAPVYYAIPVVVLLLFSAIYVYTEVEGDRLNALISGASLAVGYLAVSFIVVLGIRFGLGQPIPVIRAIVFGVLFPVVLGGIGGLVANEVRNYTEG
ncbi:MAG: hypothetical protein U5J64_01265 [Halobacteriales archaeon]|nr:hypothetical protein [Halobacteriales archaeon]